MTTIDSAGETSEPAPPNPLEPILWLIDVAWQYKWLLVTIVVAGVLAAAIVAGRLPNTYTAGGLVAFDAGREEIFPTRQADRGYVPPETVTETEVQVIQSYTVLERVVDELGLEFSAVNPALELEEPGGMDRGMARAQIVSALRQNLTVAPTGRSFVVSVRYEARDPRFAAAVVNEVMRQYLDLDISAQRDLATDAIAQISIRLRDLRRDLDERERALQDFRAQSRIAEGAGTTILTEQLGRMNEELIRAQAALAQADAANDLRGGEDGALPQVVASPLIQQLRTQVATQERVVSELDALYQPSHPRLIQAREALAALRQTIATETQKIVSSLGSSADAEAERVAALRRQVDILRDQLVEQREAEIELRRLEREVEAARRVYEALLNRYNEAQGTAGLERAGGRIVAPAVAPTQPSGPKRMLVVAGGGILSGGAAFALIIGLALLDQRIRTRADVRRTVGIAPVALVPPVPPARPTITSLGSWRRRNAAFAEAITHLRAALVLGSGGRDTTIVAITGADERVGHGALVTALAQACAVAGEEAVLVDTDFTRPTIHLRLGGVNEFGVSDLVAEGGEIDAALQIDPSTPLKYLAAGRRSDPALYRAAGMGALIDALVRRFDVVLINLPTIVDHPDAQALAAEADVVAVAVKTGLTSKTALLETVQTMRFVGPGLPLATVLIRG
ncbi:exopolysaccharide transport family protein [Acuticoccus sp. I52.16.1]|uniref:GumC family protein n=1 Tax=Acuticoccus sp. I52.16.1 TaxID=2928472 RepID=UPI001FD42CEC|nr:exopolysaccharide transport family protein [Acuticoccus sp. I52.16.1]UOM36016.1 exopolysaccharide transport family protein [Acuticoccus sp. I52.16.1]